MTLSWCFYRFPSWTPETSPEDISEARTRMALSSHTRAPYPCETDMGCTLSFSETHKKYLRLVGGIFLYFPVKVLFDTESLMIKSEEFSFFFEESFYSIDDFFGYIFSIEVSFSHIRIVVCSSSYLRDETSIDRRSEDICSSEECFTSVTTKSDSHTRNPNDICFFLHAA